MRHFLVLLLGFFGLITFFIINPNAQEDEKSRLISFVENQLSTDNRRISLNGLQGSLSSNVTLESITIADRDGIWLAIEKPALRWKRLSLLQGRLHIESLTAARIQFFRPPLPDESSVLPEATPFQMPDLPIAVRLDRLSVPDLSFSKPLFGLQAKARLDGRLVLDDGELDTTLSIERLGDVQGSFLLNLSYKPNTDNVAINVRVNEPENGIIVNALNLSDKSPFALSIAGVAPLDNLVVQLDLDVGQENTLDGNLEFSRPHNDLEARLNAKGRIAELLPQPMQQMFGVESSLEAEFSFKRDGEIRLEDLTLLSGVVKARASFERLADGFLSALETTITLGEAADRKINIRDDFAFDTATLSIDYNARKHENWTARLDVNALKSGEMTVGTLRLEADGLVENFDQPNSRGGTFSLSGEAGEMDASHPALAQALGGRLAIGADGHWRAGQPVTLQHLTLNGPMMEASLNGVLDNFAFAGQLDLTLDDLVAFAPLAKRDLSGGAMMHLQGTISPLSGIFDFAVSGETTELTLGNPSLDAILEGKTSLNGKVARTQAGLVFNQMKLANNVLLLSVDGTFSSQMAYFTMQGRLEDLGRLQPDSTGAVEVKAELTGTQPTLEAQIMLQIAQGRLLDRQIDNAFISLAGTINRMNFQGALTGGGTLDQRPLAATGSLSYRDDIMTLSGLDVDLAGTKLSGDLQRLTSGLLNGVVEWASPDISPAATLALMEARGEINGRASFSIKQQQQIVDISAAAQSLQIAQNRLGDLDLKAVVEDAFSTPKVTASIAAKDVEVAGLSLTTLQAKAENDGAITAFDAIAELQATGKTTLLTKGIVTQNENEIQIEINELEASSRQISARLANPTTITHANHTTTIHETQIAVGSGRLNLKGMVGNEVDLNVRALQMPVSLANDFVPDLNASGELSGEFALNGPFETLSGKISLNGTALSASVLADYAIEPFDFAMQGQIDAKSLSVANAEIKNEQGVRVNAVGLIPFNGTGLDVKVDGLAPLALGNGFLNDRGTSLSGQVTVQTSTTGSLVQPIHEGLITVNDGTITDPLTNARLERIGALIGLRDQKLFITRANANVSNGGTLQASGQIELEPALPANLSLTIDRALYNDGQLMQAVLSGNLTLSGELATSPLLAGTIALDKLEIAVPDNLTANADLLDVTHLNADQRVLDTLQNTGQTTAGAADTGEKPAPRIDIKLDAPRRIFVRGRGLDAELGGTLQLRGRSPDIEPVGAFSLARGRLLLLTRRLDLTSGSITFSGDLDPVLNFVAATNTPDFEIQINLSGNASNPQFTFSSTPTLPEDEVLARLIFDRGLSDLSPVQIARLALLATQLAGGEGVGAIDSFRSTIGLDDLDVVGAEDGSAAVRVGKHINENVYLDIQAGRESEANINLDIINDLTARGAVNSEGDTSLGVFFERDF